MQPRSNGIIHSWRTVSMQGLTPHPTPDSRSWSVHQNLVLLLHRRPRSKALEDCTAWTGNLFVVPTSSAGGFALAVSQEFKI